MCGLASQTLTAPRADARHCAESWTEMGKPKKRPAGRTSVKGKHRKPALHSRISVPLGTKIDAVEFFQECLDISRTIDRFFPKLSDAARSSIRKRIYEWQGEYAKLKESCSSEAMASKRYVRKDGAGTVLTDAIEKEIVEWVNCLRKEGVPVSPFMLACQAKQVAKDHGISMFKASWSWQKGFAKRHAMSMRERTRQGQIRPQDAVKVAREFAATLQLKMQELGVTRVYNADQTAAFFEYLPKKTLSPKGAKTVWVRCGGKSKERATVMLTGDSDGNKYPAFVVHKMRRSASKEMHAENVKERHGFSKTTWYGEIVAAQEATGMQLYCNPTGWWNEDLHVRYLEYQFGNRPSPETPVLLMIDDFSGHWTSQATTYAASIGVHLLKVPPCYTSVCQPADISWNRPFKTRLRGLWLDSIRVQAEQRGGGGFKMKAPTRNDMTSWIQLAWSGLSAQTVASGFTKLLETDPATLSESSQAIESVSMCEQGHDPITEAIVELLEQCHLIDAEVREEEDFAA